MLLRIGPPDDHGGELRAAYAMRPLTVARPPPTRVSFAGQVVDRILSVVERIMRLAQSTFPKQPSRAARRLKSYWAGAGVYVW
jgi:hypothetical protein